MPSISLKLGLVIALVCNASSVFAETEDLTGDAERGKRLFNQCKACHSLTESDRKRVGPTLHGIFEREVGTVEGYSYSAALKETSFIWTPEHLNDWLTKPNAYLPGNKMPYAGMRDAQDRKDLIAYLEKATVSLTDKEN